MYCRRADYLIEDVRREVEDLGATDEIGMQDSSYLMQLNDGLSRIHSLIVGKYPMLFTQEIIIALNRGDYQFNIPVDAFMGNKITDVKYSFNNRNWQPLNLLSKKRDTTTTVESYLRGYYRESGVLKLIGSPSANSQLKYTYVKKLPKLQLTAATVGAVTLDPVTLTITVLEADLNEDINIEDLNKATRLCVVDREGNVKMQNIKFDSVDSTTGVFTISSGFTYSSGETIEIGDTIVTGPYSSTHPLIDDYVEKYLISYATMKMLQRDGAVEVGQQTQVLLAMEQEIVDSYSTVSHDIQLIQDVSQNYYNDDWEY